MAEHTHDTVKNQDFKAAVIVCSDRASAGTYEDRAGPAVQAYLQENGFALSPDIQLIPDDASALRAEVCRLAADHQLLAISGGTGLAPRDLTPQTLAKLCDYEVVGIGEFLRAASFKYSENSFLGRGGAWVLGRTLVLTLPGNPNAVREQLSELGPMLARALNALQGTCTHRQRRPATQPESTSDRQNLKTYEEALALLQTLPPLLSTVEVPLAAARGRVLATDLQAPIDHPPFTNSAMDGFAYKQGPQPVNGFKVMKTLYAAIGTHSEGLHLGPEDCVRIMTGAPLPPGTDTVVPVEQSEALADGRVRFLKDFPVGSHVRHRGADIQAGAALLAAGTYLSPELILVCASFGLARLQVRALPRFGLCATGDELVTPGEPLGPAGIYNSTRYFLQSALAQLGLSLSMDTSVADHKEVAGEKLRSFFAEPGPALLITTGAVSAGDLDFVPELARDCGFELIFHKVAVRPGKPIFLARRGQQLWLGIPGNPISTVTSWYFFLRPLLSQWLGLPSVPKVSVKLAEDITKPLGLRCFFRAIVDAGQARLAGHQGSANLLASLTANAYIELPEHLDRLPKGSSCQAILLQNVSL